MTMPIIFAGTPETAASVLRSLVTAGEEISLVITREDAPFGRKRELRQSPVADAADELGITVLKTNQPARNETEIRESGAELAIVVAYGALLKQSTIDLLRTGWFNLHYSLLPRFRGASPVQSALLAGDRETGVTIFKIDSGMDTGEVLAQLPTQIEPDENSGRLLDRLTQLGTSLLLQELPRLRAGIFDLKPQLGEPTNAAKITRDAARIQLSEGASTAYRKTLAFNPEPGAWLLFNGAPFRVLSAKLARTSLSPGELSPENEGVLIGFGDGQGLLLTQVQPAGKAMMNAKDWFRGTRENARTIE
ncbi:MAG: hypothetical protein RL510_68 [Actinomycetota bacterium]|jgi:methionyl-tRNA formyltransferase